MMKCMILMILTTNILDDETEDQCEVEDPQDRRDWDRFDSTLREVNSIPGRGWKVSNENPLCLKFTYVI